MSCQYYCNKCGEFHQLKNKCKEEKNNEWNNYNNNITMNSTQIEEQIQSSANYSNILGTILMITILLAIITIGFLIWYYNKKYSKAKEYKETQKELEKLVKQILTIDESLESKTLEIDEININNLPQKLKLELTDKTNILNKLFTDLEKTKEPFLLLMLKNGKIEIRKRIREGEIELIDPKTKEKKTILIDASKKHRINFGNKDLFCYIHYEDEAEGYPHQPKHYSKAFYQIVQAIKLAEGLIQPQGKGIGKIWIILGILVVIGGIGYFWWSGQQPNSTITEGTITAINQTINNTLSTTTNTGISQTIKV